MTDPAAHTTTPAGGPLPTTSSSGYVPVTLEDNSSNPLQFNSDKGTGIFNANRSDMDSLSVYTQGLSLLRANSGANATTAVPSSSPGHPLSTSSGGQLLFMDPSLTSSALSKAFVSNSRNSVIGGTNSSSSHYPPTVPEADRGTVNQSSTGMSYLPRQYHQEMDRESKDKNGNTGNQLETFAPSSSSSSSAPTFKDYYSSKLLPGELPAGDLHGSTEKYVPGKSNDNVNDIIMPSSYRFVALSEQKPHSQQMPMMADDGTVARARILADDKYNKDQGEDRGGAGNNQSATSTTNFQRPELENYTQQQLKLKGAGEITPETPSPMNYYLRNTDHYFDDYVAQDVTRSEGGGGNRWKVAEDGNKDKDIPVGSSSSPSSSFSVTAGTNSSHPQPQQVHQKWEKVVEVDEDEDRCYGAGQAVGNHSQRVTGSGSTFLSKSTPDHFIDTLGGNKWSSLSTGPIIHQDKPPASASAVATSDKEWNTNSKQQTNYYDMSAEEKRRNPRRETGDELTGRWDAKKKDDGDEVHGLYDKNDDHHQRQKQDSYYQQPMGNQNTTVGGNNKSLHKLQLVPEEVRYEDNYEKTDVGSEKPYKYEREELDQGEFNYPQGQSINQNNYPDRIEGGPGLVSGEHNMSSFTNGQLRYSPQQQLPSGSAGGQYGSPNKSFAYERSAGPHQQKEEGQGGEKEEQQQENANIYSSPQKKRIQSPVDASQVPVPPPEGGNSNQGSPRKRMTQLQAQQQLEEKPLEMDQSYYAQGDSGTQQLQQQQHSYQEELPEEYLGNSSTTATPSTLVNHPSHPAGATSSDPAYPEVDAHDALALNQQQQGELTTDEYSTSPKGDLMHPVVGTYQSQSHYEPGNNNTGVVDDYGGNYEESGYVAADGDMGHQGAMDYSNYLADTTPAVGGQGDEAYLSNYTNEQEYTGGAAVDGSDYGNHQTGDVLQSTSYGDEMGHGGDYQEYYNNNEEQQSYATPGQEGIEGQGQVEGVNYDGNYSTVDGEASGLQGYYTDQQSQEAHQGDYYEEPAYQQNQMQQQEESQQQEQFQPEYYSEPIDYNNHQSATEQQPLPAPAVTGATVSFAPEPEVSPEKPKKPIKKVQILESSDSEQTQRQQQTKRGPTGGVLKGGLLKNKKATPTSSDSSDFNFSSK